MPVTVRISSCGCTWKVWGAVKKQELLSAAPKGTLTLVLSKLPTNIHTNPYLYVRTLSMNHLFNRRHLSQLWSDILTRHFWWYRYHKTTPHKLSTSLEDGPKDLWKGTKIVVSEKSTTVIDEIVLGKYPLFPYQVQSRDILIENHKYVTSATRVTV